MPHYLALTHSLTIADVANGKQNQRNNRNNNEGVVSTKRGDLCAAHTPFNQSYAQGSLVHTHTKRSIPLYSSIIQLFTQFILWPDSL